MHGYIFKNNNYQLYQNRIEKMNNAVRDWFPLRACITITFLISRLYCCLQIIVEMLWAWNLVVSQIQPSPPVRPMTQETLDLNLLGNHHLSYWKQEIDLSSCHGVRLFFFLSSILQTNVVNYHSRGPNPIENVALDFGWKKR